MWSNIFFTVISKSIWSSYPFDVYCTLIFLVCVLFVANTFAGKFVVAFGAPASPSVISVITAFSIETGVPFESCASLACCS